MQLIKDSEIDLDLWMNEEESHDIKPASSWVQDVIDHFHKPQESPRVRLPWSNTHSTFQVRTGEVSLWAGINGHGKSMMSGQAALGLCYQGERCCLASLEMPPSKTMARMSRQMFGSFEPTIPYIEQFGKWTNDKLWIYDHVGSCKPNVMLAVIRYSIATYGITQFFVDNLMKVVAGEDSYNEQKDFVNGLCTIAHDTGCHIHLILHVKKLKDEETQPNKFDIKGTGAITDLVDNVFIVWRNKKKEKTLLEGNATPDEPDAILLLEKQRNAEDTDTGVFRFWFNGASMQYLEDRYSHPICYDVATGISSEEVEF
jgi:twinkle protein